MGWKVPLSLQFPPKKSFPSKHLSIRWQILSVFTSLYLNSLAEHP